MLAVARRSGLWHVSCAELALHLPALRSVATRAHGAQWRSVDRLAVDATSGGLGALAWAPSGSLAGFAWVRPGTPGTRFTELVDMAVDPAFQGQSYGAALHDALLPELDDGPALAQCHAGAAPALGLLRSRGWRVCTASSAVVHLRRDGRPADSG